MFITTKHHVYHREDDVYNYDYTAQSVFLQGIKT